MCLDVMVLLDDAPALLMALLGAPFVMRLDVDVNPTRAIGPAPIGERFVLISIGMQSESIEKEGSA